MADPELFLGGRIRLFCSDCLDVLATLPENSVDSCCTDPPYHLTSIIKRFGSPDAAPAKPFGKSTMQDKTWVDPQAKQFVRLTKGFMGKQWDGGDIAQSVDLWRQVYRVLKPGAHLLAFGGTRTYHRMACAIEDAGFEIRDCIAWVYGQGFPKSHDVSKGIDRAAGAEREVIGTRTGVHVGDTETYSGDGKCGFSKGEFNTTAPATDAARQWEGWGTALKPACEPIVLARKPLSEKTVASNVLRWGTGAINVDGCRVGTGGGGGNGLGSHFDRLGDTLPFVKHGIDNTDLIGRWPANVIHDGSEEVLAGFPDAKAAYVNQESALAKLAERKPTIGRGITSFDDEKPCTALYTDSGSAARFFYEVKPDEPAADKPKGRWPANVITDGSPEVLAGFPESGNNWREDKSGGCEYFMGGDKRGPTIGGQNDSGSAARFFYTAKADSHDRIGSKHPTVKPLDLMQYLVRLITPKGGTVLDMFAGSGTTGEAAFREGMHAILIEKEQEYQSDIRRRMELCLAGPDERSRQSIKAKMKGKPQDHGPLFCE